MLQSSKGSAKLPPGPEGRRLRNLHERLFACEASPVAAQQRLRRRRFVETTGHGLLRHLRRGSHSGSPHREAAALPEDAATGDTVHNDPQCRARKGELRRPRPQISKRSTPCSPSNAWEPTPRSCSIIYTDCRAPGESGRTIDAKEEIYRVTARIMADSCVGGDLQLGQGLVRKALKGTKWDYGLDYLPLKSLLRRLPLPQNLSARRSFGAMHRIVNESMRRGRKPSNGRSDWVSCLVRDGSAASPPFSDEEVRDEAIDLLVGNLDPLAVALTWCLSYVARNPSVSERIEQEVDEVLGGRAMAAEDYDRLPYARAVFQESLRLAPPAFFMEREATEDCVLGGRHLVPKGTVVQLCMGIVHRKRKHFDQPDQFKPERWLHDPPPGCPAHVYMPFSYQPRRCAAWEFCTMTGTYLVASRRAAAAPRSRDGQTRRIGLQAPLRPEGPRTGSGHGTRVPDRSGTDLVTC